MSEYKPKIGEICEYFWDDGGEWRRCAVIALHNSKFVIADYEGLAYEGLRPDTNKFRPLKTKAEIEREEAIEQMVKIIDDIHCWNQSECISRLYDAGYHNGVKVGKKVSFDEMLDQVENYPQQEIDGYISKNFDIFRKTQS